MPLFTYKAVREDGTSVSDEVVATDAATLRQELEARGYLVLSLEKKKAFFGGGRGSPKDFLIFNQEFATLVKAGLPILPAIEMLNKRAGKPGFRNALENVINDIKGGLALSDAMARHPAYFPPLYTATVRAGEKSGALVDVLKRFIVYQKKMITVLSKLKMALAYPVFLVCALVAVLLLFFIYIIPNFTQMYSEAGSLPLLTQLLVSFTSVLSRYAPLIALGLLAAGAGLYLWRRTESGRMVLDGLKLKVPFVRTLYVQYVLAQLTRTLSTVLRGGIPIVQALDTISGVIANKVIAGKLLEVRELVTQGVGIADAFERTRLAPDMTVRMIAVGESSGDLAQMLEDVADFYDQEVETTLAALTTLIEPVLMLSMGIIVAVIVVALYLPIFEMGSRLK